MSTYDSRRERLLEEVFRANYQQLLRFARKLSLGDRARAEDIVQETMVRAWQHIDELDVGRDVARPWLFTVARRVAIDGMRSRAVRPAEVSGAMLAAQPVDADCIEQTLTALHIRSLLSSLPPRHRAVLENLYLLGRTLEETAKLLGIPAGTVKSRRFHALRVVRRAMSTGPRR